jgi:transcriptional regulator with XRE-family HTH domain
MTMPAPNGTQIRLRRKERGLTTAQLAARVGFTNEGSMRNIESRGDAVSEIKLHRIARELGVAVGEITAAGQADDDDQGRAVPPSWGRP